jgi:hypothetical protein
MFSMNAPLHPFENAPADPDWERAARHAEVLEELAELGMSMARMMKGQVCEQLKYQERVDVAAVSTAFSRVSRSVRQCLALEDRLAEHHATRAQRIARALRRAEEAPGEAPGPLTEAPAGGVEAAAACPPEPTLSGARMSAATRKAAVVKAVADILRAEPPEREAAERDDDRLLDDLWDRADEFDDLDFKTRPIGEIAAMICADLRVVVDWKRWGAADWAAAEIRERNRRSPFFRADVAGTETPSMETGGGRTLVRKRGPP